MIRVSGVLLCDFSCLKLTQWKSSIDLLCNKWEGCRTTLQSKLSFAILNIYMLKPIYSQEKFKSLLAGVLSMYVKKRHAYLTNTKVKCGYGVKI